MPKKAKPTRKKKHVLKGNRPKVVKEFYRKVLALQEEERKRISRDLHDETGQIVIALGAVLNVIEKELKAKRIEKALAVINENRGLVQEMASKMKFMAFNLRPPALDILGLSAVLREYFSQCTSSGSVRVEFKENLKDAKLNDNLEIALYRIIQEAIWNALKHAKPESIIVELLFSGDTIKVFIEDDGQGFSVKGYLQQADVAKMGLRGIRERVDILNGTFSVESKPGAGTKLQIVLPLEQQGESINGD